MQCDHSRGIAKICWANLSFWRSYIQTSFKNLDTSSVPEQTIPTGIAVVKGEEPEVSEWEKLKCFEEVKPYLKSNERLNFISVAVYNVIWFQCSRKIQNRFKGNEKYEGIRRKHEVNELFKLICKTYNCISIQNSDSPAVWWNGPRNAEVLYISARRA